MLSFILRSNDGDRTMIADKRTVATDALETLGTILGPDEGRDAIHLAVEPVMAGEDLSPGEHVGFSSPGVAVGEGACEKLLGIVDPFLRRKIREGQRFWLILYPGQITSLRHVWTHPDFDGPPSSPAEPAPTTPGESDRLAATLAAALDEAVAMAQADPGSDDDDDGGDPCRSMGCYS